MFELNVDSVDKDEFIALFRNLQVATAVKVYSFVYSKDQFYYRLYTLLSKSLNFKILRTSAYI